MDKARMGVIGCGGIGTLHISYLPQVQGAELTAVCDIDPKALERAKARSGAAGFATHQELIDSGRVDAVIVSPPHYFHPEVMVYAFSKGIHVLSEKPVGVHVKHALWMNQTAAAHPQLVFGVMFQSRGDPANRKAKALIDSGEMGQMLRITCVQTRHYRTQSYYDSGGWRATWAGEGGGTLINQCPHALDIFTWLGGRPKRVTAVCKLGLRHNIEVEDEVAAILEYENGALGQFISSTGEAPGSSLFEIAFDRGLLTVRDKGLEFRRNCTPVLEHLKHSPERFAKPETWKIDVPLPKPYPGEPHQAITQNFVNAILKGEVLIAPGVEGIYGLELGNAILLSGLKGKPVDLPLDPDEMEALITQLCKKSTYVKSKTVEIRDDVAASFR